jgi:alpha-ribazole phosphatase
LEIYLIRHTRPDVPEGLCYGRQDVPLDESDLEARLPLIASHLPRGMLFHSSPASRCARLAERLAAATGGSLAALDARLHELDFGDWEGRPWRDLPREQTEPWTGDIVNCAPPNGEYFIAMWERVAEAYQAILLAADSAKHASVGVVGHAGSLKVLLMRALKLAPHQYASADIAQGRVTRIDVSRTAAGERIERLMFLNR